MDAAFSEHVRDAFAHLDDLAYLRSQPLARLLAPEGQALSGDDLRRRLLASIDRLKPPEGAPRQTALWRRHRYLRLRYLEGVSHESISTQLGVSTRQARRDHLEALDVVSSALWDSRAVRSAPPEATGDAPHGRDPASPPEGQARRTPLDLELLESSFGPASSVADVVEVVTGVVDLIGSLPAGSRRAIEVALPDGLPMVSVDRAILRQILLSLLNYASVVGPAGGLSLVAAPAGDRVVLGLATTAAGARRPTRRSDGEMAEAQALLDAGRRLAELHGVEVEIGRALVDRSGSGEALSIDVSVPIARLTTVLVVDDNPGVARLFERYLRRTAYRVLAARGGPQALELAREARPGVITLDVVMPSQDGWDILRQLREHDETRDVPVIVCSVMPERSLALAMGAAGFLAKPVSQESLLECLAESRGGHRAGRPGCP